MNKPIELIYEIMQQYENKEGMVTVGTVVSDLEFIANEVDHKMPQREGERPEEKECPREFPSCGMPFHDICHACKVQREQAEELDWYRDGFRNLVEETIKCDCGGKLEWDGYCGRFVCQDCESDFAENAALMIARNLYPKEG